MPAGGAANPTSPRHRPGVAPRRRPGEPAVAPARPRTDAPEIGRVPSTAKMRYPMGAPGRGYPGDLDPQRTAADQRRAIGSAGERLVHTEEVTGSIPVSPTDVRPGQRLHEQLSSHAEDGSCSALGAIWEVFSLFSARPSRLRGKTRPLVLGPQARCGADLREQVVEQSTGRTDECPRAVPAGA